MSLRAVSTRSRLHQAERRVGRRAASAIAQAAFFASVLLLPQAVQAQGRDFLFGRPKGNFALRVGGSAAPAGSDVFDFFVENLTVGNGDFAGFAAGADFGARVADRLDITFGGGFTNRSHSSVYRDWVDTDDREIEQTTSFLRVPLNAGVRFYLLPPGRSISQLSWVPAKVVPYVGAGGGAMYYRLKQAGSFLDYEDLSVFDSEIKSTGWAPAAYANVGVDYALRPSFGLLVEARYDYARADLDNAQWQDFGRLNLSGVSASIGLNFRF